MPIVVREEAEEDIRSALTWYAARRPGLEIEFLEALNDVFAFLLRSPNGAQRIKGQIRKLPMERFPYLIIHSVEKDEVVVLHVFHGRRDPKSIRRRSRTKR